MVLSVVGRSGEGRIGRPQQCGTGRSVWIVARSVWIVWDGGVGWEEGRRAGGCEGQRQEEDGVER